MVLELNTTNYTVPTVIVEEHEESMEKYEESVDLQNDCRSFYLNRVKASEHLKQKLNGNATENGSKITPRNSLSSAMDKLRSEMASLVDQDLSLMKQLLTLNETIEELKTKRLNGVKKDSLEDSMDYIGKSVSMLSLDSEHSGESSIRDEACLQSSNNNIHLCSDSGYGD